MEFTDWHRQVAAGIAAAHPLTPTRNIRAGGNHRVAQNDEPELTEQDVEAAVTALNAEKARRYHQTRDRRALELQINGPGALR